MTLFRSIHAAANGLISFSLISRPVLNPASSARHEVWACNQNTFLWSKISTSWVFCNSNYFFKSIISWAFPGGPLVKNLPCNAGDMGLILGQGTNIPNALALALKNPRPAAREPMRHDKRHHLTTRDLTRHSEGLKKQINFF